MVPGGGDNYPNISDHGINSSGHLSSNLTNLASNSDDDAGQKNDGIY